MSIQSITETKWRFTEVWDWMVDRELLTPDGAVEDGVDVRNCDGQCPFTSSGSCRMSTDE